MEKDFSYSLVNPQTNNLAFKFFSLAEDNPQFNYIQRLGYFVLIILEEGQGNLKVDFNESELLAPCFLSFAPYQPFMIEAQNSFKGKCIMFHPEFFCIYKHMQDVACDGVLFNNVYGIPKVELNKDHIVYLNGLISQMNNELPVENFGQCDMLISLLRIFMIYTSRLKIEQNQVIQESSIENKEPFILQDLKNAIEGNFKQKHSPKEYAELLNITPNGLAKICKKYYQKTLTNLISERIIIEAKRELYLTTKPIKQIAYELGYNDEHYFSRFFKKNSEVSPQIYRDSLSFSTPN